MRIVAYTNLYMPMCRAGAQTMLRDLLRPLRDRHQVSIVVENGLGRTEPYWWEGIRVYPDARLAEHCLASADLLIAHLQGVAPAARVADERDVPLIQLLHAEERHDREFFSNYRCDLLVFNSDWTRASVPEYQGRSLVVQPPVRPGEYRTTPGNAVTLVNVSRIKGSELFYELAGRFLRQRFLGVRGGYAEQDIRGLPNIEILDATDDMRAVYGRTRVLLMPSEYESFGRCAIEAAASGIPTIAAPTPGLRESLGDSGYLCEVDDPDGWVGALTELMRPEVWREASELSRGRSTELAIRSRAQLRTWRAAVESYAPAGVRA